MNDIIILAEKLQKEAEVASDKMDRLEANNRELRNILRYIQDLTKEQNLKTQLILIARKVDMIPGLRGQKEIECPKCGASWYED